MALLTNLAGYWKLDGNSNDASGNGHNGTDTSVSYSTGKINNGMVVAGSSRAKITLPTGTWVSRTAFSFSFWYKNGTSDSNDHGIIGWGTYQGTYHWAIIITVNNTGGRLNVALFPTDNTSAGSTNHTTTTGNNLNDGNWHHVVVTYLGSSNRITIYVDNTQVLQSTSAPSQLADETGRNMYLGFDGDIDFDGDFHHLNGSMDEVGYWTRELTSAEVTSLYNSGNGFAYPFATNQPVAGTTTGVGAIARSVIRAKTVAATTTVAKSLTPAATYKRTIAAVSAGVGALAKALIYARALGDSSLLTNIRGYWSFNAGSGTTVADDTGRGNTGTWTGTPGYGTGSDGRSDGSFTGSNYVVVGDVADTYFGTGAFTLSARIKTTATVRQTILGKYLYTGTATESGYYIDMLASGVLRVVYETTNTNLRNTDGSIAINDGKWHDIVAVRPSTTGEILLYVDGVLDSAATHPYSSGTPGSIDNSIPFGIGQSIIPAMGVNIANWTGEIDEVGIWNRALSATEIASEYGRSYPYGAFTRAVAGLTKAATFFRRLGTFTNVASQANGGVASASSAHSSGLYSPSLANDGNRDNYGWGTGTAGGWNDDTNGVFPDWLEIDFNRTYPISEIDVITLYDDYTNSHPNPTLTDTFTLYGIIDFLVQYWDGSAWQTISTVTGNNKIWRQFTFSPIWTNKIRVYITNAGGGYSRIVELEAWANKPVTSTVVPALSRIANYFRTIAALSVGVGSITRAITYLRTIAATEISVSSITRFVQYRRTLAATSTGVSGLSRMATYARTLAAATIGVASLSRLAWYYRTLSATVTGVPTVVRTAAFFRTIAATVTGVGSLSRLAQYRRTISATVVSVPALARAATFFRTIAATTIPLVSISRLASYYRTLAAVEITVPTLSRTASYLRSLAAVEVSVPGLSRIANRYMTISAAVTGNPGISRLLNYGRALSAQAVIVPSLARAALYSRILAASTAGSAALDRIKVLLASLSATVQAAGTLSRIATRYRTLAATSAVSVSISRFTQRYRVIAANTIVLVSLNPRLFAQIALQASISAVAGLKRLANRYLVLAGNVAVSPRMDRILSFYRTLAASASVVPTLSGSTIFSKILSGARAIVRVVLAIEIGRGPKRDVYDLRSVYPAPVTLVVREIPSFSIPSLYAPADARCEQLSFTLRLQNGPIVLSLR